MDSYLIGVPSGTEWEPERLSHFSIGSSDMFSTVEPLVLSCHRQRLSLALQQRSLWSRELSRDSHDFFFLVAG